ncbi:MAG: PKD domain-containing protein [Candidatus Bipolaricaulis sp.]|nr:PKD domain-containing protein [Candidatus Bipolaricaulis sp.]
MKRGTCRVGATLILLIALVGAVGWAQGVAPKGIIPTPPESTELEVRVWVDRGAYAVGEPITIHYSVNKAAYIYVWDITPDGQANQIFPNTFPGGSNNYVAAGEHTIPGDWRVVPPLGTEYLQILATTSPVDPFAYFSPDPESFQAQIEVQILGVLPVSERSWNFTSFEIVSGTVPSYGILNVTSVPAGATIVLDGQYAGYTPRTLYVSQGFHEMDISKAGHRSWHGAIFVIGGRTRDINATLAAIVPPNQSPVPAFVFVPSSPNVNEWVQFDASASFDPDGTIASFAWAFGDGLTGTGPTVWHRYAAGGAYTVTLTVTDNLGAASPVSELLQVGPTNQQPVALFTADPAVTSVGGWVQFDATASYDVDGTIVTYAWTFGDGTTDSGATVWHRFNVPGALAVTLTVTDDKGAQDVETHSVQVGSLNNPPTAAFAYAPPMPLVMEWVQFDASASSDSDGTVASYQWAFGDGSTSSTGPVVYHQFATTGSFSVTLTVVDDDGATNAQTKLVQVGVPAQAPVAAFVYSPASPAPGQPITLDASSSYDPDGTIATYEWDLDGDGTTDQTGRVIQLAYLTAGTVPVRLTVTDGTGLQNSTTQMITVASTPAPSGTPVMGTTPGFFIWGTDTWHVTVNAGSGWSAARAYRIELRTDGVFSTVNQTATTGVAPMGLVPTPTTGNKTLIFEGTLKTGNVDYTFTVPGATSLWFSLKLDADGNGTLDSTPSFIYLRAAKVRPVVTPFVVGLPSGYTGDLVPSIDFRIGMAIPTYPGGILYTTSISQLGG